MTTCLISRRRPVLGGSCARARRTLGGISTEAAAAAAVPTAASKNLRLVLGATAGSGEPLGFIIDILVEKIWYRVSGRASCLIQDEPEIGHGFSHKMSLKDGIGMLGIDHRHGRFRSDKPGAGPGVSGRKRRGEIHRAAEGRGVCLDGTNAGAAP